MRIIYMGTPEFAVAGLKALVENKFQVVGVVTVADKPAGRGQVLQESAVKKYALEKGLKILQPLKLKDPEFIETLKGLSADLQVVVAFRMLPEVVWNMPSLGTINLHASLLPQYRGAAPINWAIINGEKESGVSTFFLKQEIDTGNILFQEKYPIDPNTNAGELHDALMELGAKTILKTVQAIEKKNYKEIPQDHLDPSKLKHAPKIFKADCQINWEHSAQNIHNFIRGLSPYPAAWTELNGKNLKIYAAQFQIESHTQLPGTYHSDGKKFLKFYCKDGVLHIQELQLEGKKKMGIEEFLRGNKLASS